MDIIAYLVLSFCFLLFLYFGYRNDFRRGPKEFISTVLGVFIIGSIFVILKSIELDLPMWIKVSILIGFLLLKILVPNSKEENILDADK